MRSFLACCSVIQSVLSLTWASGRRCVASSQASFVAFWGKLRATSDEEFHVESWVLVKELASTPFAKVNVLYTTHPSNTRFSEVPVKPYHNPETLISLN